MVAPVDLGQGDGEHGGEDGGESSDGENGKVTALALFIDRAGGDSCVGSNGRSRNGAPLDG